MRFQTYLSSALLASASLITPTSAEEITETCLFRRRAVIAAPQVMAAPPVAMQLQWRVRPTLFGLGYRIRPVMTPVVAAAPQVIAAPPQPQPQLRYRLQTHQYQTVTPEWYYPQAQPPTQVDPQARTSRFQPSAIIRTVNYEAQADHHCEACERR